MENIIMCQANAISIPIQDRSVNCVVTSPPYWGLRNYGVDGQLGVEKAPEEYVANLVCMFREVWRVLRDDGTCWLNIGDSYASGKGTCYNPGGGKTSMPAHAGRKQAQAYPLDRGNISTLRRSGLKPKDLVGIPWRVALALQADGWWLRSDIIWHKTNPMPESVRDRPTKSHEYIFLLSKSKRYYYDCDAIKEPLAESSIGRAERFKAAMEKYGRPGRDTSKHVKDGIDQSQGNAGIVSGRSRGYHKSGRNKRTVWTVSTKPYKGAHYAVFPTDLIEPCILAGCPEGGIVLDPFCGSGTVGEVAREHGRKSVLLDLSFQYLNSEARTRLM